MCETDSRWESAGEHSEVSDRDGWSGGAREPKAEGVRVRIQLTHFIAQQKPILHCKAPTPQLKWKKKITSNLNFSMIPKVDIWEGSKKT